MQGTQVRSLVRKVMSATQPNKYTFKSENPHPQFVGRVFFFFFLLPSSKAYDTLIPLSLIEGFPGGSDGKESACNAGDPGSIFGWGRSPGKRNGYPLQYSCLGNPMNRGVWQATGHGVAKSQT